MHCGYPNTKRTQHHTKLAFAMTHGYQTYLSGVMFLSRIICTQAQACDPCLDAGCGSKAHVKTESCATIAVKLERNGQNCQQ